MAALIVQMGTHTLDNKMVLEASFPLEPVETADDIDMDTASIEPTANGKMG